MNRILKISLISAGSVLGTALISGISYVKGKKDGILLTKKAYESGQIGVGADKAHATQPQA